MQPKAVLPETLPTIHIDLFQPGDRGSFVIRVTDPLNQKVITQNTLPEHVSDVQYLYTARLLEQASAVANTDTPQDSDWKKTDRYKDMIRYGQKLYNDLFGEKGEFRNYVRRSPHLKGGALYLLRLFNTASELWNIPWEYLHDGDGFLGIGGSSVIVRTTPDIPLERETPLTEVPYPLRILLFISDPRGVTPLNVDYEVQTILQALKPALDAGQVEIDIVEDGSLINLETNLTYAQYHVLYYTGHGAMTPEGSFLVMEDEEGEPQLNNLNTLRQTLRKASNLRLTILSACQSGQIDETQAASGIATGLLEVVPAVVAMQFSILDTSAQIFARTFFEQVGRGMTLESALQQARISMNQANPALADWGIPALYVHQLGTKLINPQQSQRQRTPTQKFSLESLPKPPHFVGRRSEQRKLRHILPFLNVNMAYLWGMSGSGKSALAARVVERPGRLGIIDSALVIPCDKTQPNQMLTALADWVGQFFPEAANLLRNPQMPPDRRVMAAAAQIQRRRLVLILDRFEAYMNVGPDGSHWQVINPALNAFFRAMATAPWSILTIFTSRYRWELLNELDGSRDLELHLGPLHPIFVGMLIRDMPTFKPLSNTQLNDILNPLGGHPASIYQVEGQLRRNPNMLTGGADRLIKAMSAWWGTSFMNDLINRLSPLELEAAKKLAVIESYFWTDDLQYVASIPSREEAELMMAHWEALSLIHFVYHNPENDTVCYEMDALTQTYLRSLCTPDQIKELHRGAAALIERDFCNSGRDRYRAGVGPAPIQGAPYEVALNELRLIIERGAAQTTQMFIQRALTWREHLRQIGEHQKAADIVMSIWYDLRDRFGKPDLAKELLEETVKTTSGKTQYSAQSKLATFLRQEGKFDEALKMLEDAAQRAMKDNAFSSAGVMYANQASILFQQGKYERALKVVDQAGKSYKKAGDVSGEAETLRQVADYYYYKEKYTEALKYLKAAEKVVKSQRDSGTWSVLQGIVHMQGVMHKRLGNYQQAVELYQEAYKIAQNMESLSAMGMELGEIADVLRIWRRPNDAARFILDAISIAEQLKDNRSLCVRLHTLALIHEMLGSIGDAMAIAERGLALAKSSNPSIVSVFQETIQRLRRRR